MFFSFTLYIKNIYINTRRADKWTIFCLIRDTILPQQDFTNTVFDLIGARGAYVNLFSTTSAKRSSSGR